MKEHSIKPLSDDQFEFVPEKAGTEVWVLLGVLGLIAALLMMANAKMSGGFDPFWIILPTIAAVGFGLMMPTIRQMQRAEKYRRYLKQHSKAVLKSAQESDLDDESLKQIREVLESESASHSGDSGRSGGGSVGLFASTTSDSGDSGSSSGGDGGGGGGD